MSADWSRAIAFGFLHMFLGGFMQRLTRWPCSVPIRAKLLHHSVGRHRGFAFSSFVMKALARLQPTESIAAMQSINVVAVTPAFMTALPGIAAVAVAVWAVADWNDSFCPYLLAGSALYLLGTIGPTIGSHVPRNNGVAAVQPEQVEAADRGPAT